MKKIFYFLLLMLSGFVLGQPYPKIYPLSGGFTFENETLETHSSEFSATTSLCGFTSGKIYKFYSFKAGFDMAFAFDLIAKKPDFRFLVWKIPKGQLPETIFYKGGTIEADRSVEGSTNIKGLIAGDSNSCESYSTLGADGYAKAFEGLDILKYEETVVIAVYGGSDTEPFDIKVNVAKEKNITTFNNLCKGQAYTYQQIFDAIQADSSLSDIKLFTDNTFSSEVTIGTNFTEDITLYAQVRDISGKLQYIYTIPLKFVPEHQFNFNSIINQVFECTLNYTLKENTLLNLLFPSETNLSNYKIKTVNGTAFVENSIINLTAGSITDLKIIVSYNGICPIDSVEKVIQVKQGTPEIKQNIDDVTCDSNYKISFDYIYSELSKLGIDKTQYDLIVTLNGAMISDGQSTPISTTLDYKVKVKSKIAGCESNEVNFLVTKTQPADIIDASINGTCLSDFTQIDVDNAIDIIQKGNSFHLRFYQADGITEIVESNLFNYIKTAKNGKIIVKALAEDNSNTICETTKELTFKLDESTFIKVDNIPTLDSSCSEVGLGYNFTISEIETYLTSKFGRTDITFSGISDEFLTDNQSKTIIFQVKINGESCWSEKMTLKLQVVTRPNVDDATYSTKFCEGETLIINDDLLKNYFGANVFDYKIFIEGVEYIRGNSIQKRLGFGTNTSLNISIEFKNTLRETCSKIVNLTINKKQDLVVDTGALETYTKDHSIIYCEGADENAKNQIQTILDYIQTNYSLTSSKTKDQIFDQFNSNNTEVTIDFEDPNFCGIVSIKFFYQKNTLPDFNIPASSEICSDTKYILDFEELAKEKGLDVNEYTFVVNGIDKTQISIYKYELGVGDYTITISNKDSGCPKEFTLKLLNSEIPIINKITINEKSIIVSAKGNGKLEYALFDSTGKVIVEWQTNNELIIPDNIRDNDFTVKVRLNNCGATERKNVIYLSLPNVVTPNQDGKNDFWQPMTKNGKVNDTSNSYKLIIFDRFGKQILSQEGVDIIKWDGTLNGKPVADGTYWYMLEFSKQSDDMQVLYSGSILVKRKIK